MPPLTAEEFEALKTDIAERGVLVPVEYDEDGNVLDGHHRVRACGELGIQTWPKIVRKGLTDDDKRAHARQLNIARRHLSQEQRRRIISDQLKETPELSNRQIANQLGVDHKTVGSARADLEGRGEIPHVEEVVDTKGRKQPSRKPIKYSYVDETPEGEAAALEAAKTVRAKRTEESRQNRIAKLAEIAKGDTKLGIEKRYPVIYADPPWRYENPPIGASNRSIENHFPTMTLEEICALPVSQVATNDAVLYLWATAPKLAECIEVLQAWGFAYRTCFVWVKDKIGMGYHARNQHEILLVGRRGDIPPPPIDARVSSVIVAPRTTHSKKPEEFYELIESMYPELPKIELFAREARPSWDAWGNQARAGHGEGS